MSNYVSPTGSPICGTADRILATASIRGIEDDGTPIYAGESEVHWDTQRPTTLNGNILFVDENAGEWTFDQLTKVGEDEEEDPEDAITIEAWRAAVAAEQTTQSWSDWRADREDELE